MRMLPAILARLRAHQAGATAIEYAMLAMVIAVALVTAFTNLGTDISHLWSSISNQVSSSSGG